MSQTDIWDGVSFVIASKYRTQIMQSLRDQPQTPKEIANQTGIGIAHVSRSVTELREEGYANLLVSEDRTKGRIYGLSDDGKDVAEKVAERT
jgi:predicted transcriptional regulator